MPRPIAKRYRSTKPSRNTKPHKPPASVEVRSTTISGSVRVDMVPIDTPKAPEALPQASEETPSTVPQEPEGDPKASREWLESLPVQRTQTEPTLGAHLGRPKD